MTASAGKLTGEKGSRERQQPTYVRFSEKRARHLQEESGSRFDPPIRQKGNIPHEFRCQPRQQPAPHFGSPVSRCLHRPLFPFIFANNFQSLPKTVSVKIKQDIKNSVNMRRANRPIAADVLITLPNKSICTRK
jgi:hypothetical protein